MRLVKFVKNMVLKLVDVYLVEDQMSFVGARIATDGETITDEDGEIWFKSWEIGLTQ